MAARIRSLTKQMTTVITPKYNNKVVKFTREGKKDVAR